MATYYVPNITVLFYLKYHNKHFCKHYYHMSHIMLQEKNKSIALEKLKLCLNDTARVRWNQGIETQVQINSVMNY